MQISLDLGEIESCNLAQMCTISWAMNRCFCMSINVSVGVTFRKWFTYLKLQFIETLFKLGIYKFYGKFPEGCTVGHCEIRPEYLFRI